MTDILDPDVPCPKCTGWLDRVLTEAEQNANREERQQAALKAARQLASAATVLSKEDIDDYVGGDAVGECHFCNAQNFYPKMHAPSCELRILREAIARFDAAMKEAGL